MGECVGEVSFLSGENKHNHTVVCARDCELVKISRAAFTLLQAVHPQVLLRFSQVKFEKKIYIYTYINN